MYKEANKLVRDKIPEIIKSQGSECFTKILNDDEYKSELIRKLHEEINEYEADNNIEELADIFEVFVALVHCSGYSEDDVIKVADKKRETNGGFHKRIYLTKYTDNRK